MRHGILAALLILCGLLPQAASAVSTDYHFEPTLTSDTPGDLIGVEGGFARAPGVPEPTALSLLASTLLLMWAANRLLTSRRNVSIK